MFAVKKGTDSTVLWKGTVKIACVKLDPQTKVIESYRLLNLNQFLKVFKTLQCQLTAALQSSQNEMNSSEAKSYIENQIRKRHESTSDSGSFCSDDSSYHESGMQFFFCIFLNDLDIVFFFFFVKFQIIQIHHQIMKNLLITHQLIALLAHLNQQKVKRKDQVILN